MTLLKRKMVLLAKIESTYGTDSVPTAASNSIPTMDIQLKETFEPVQRDLQLSSMSRKKTIGIKRFIEVTFMVELFGSGSAGTAPRTGALLQACGMSETVVSSTSVTYKPTSSNLKSCTLYIYVDGKRHIVTGAVGTFKVTATAGSQAMLEFTMTGMYADPTDTSLVSPTFESTVDSVPLVKSAGLTLNSVDLVVNEFTLDMGNNVVPRPSVNAAYAIAGFHITDRQPVATIDPESELIATYDYRSDVLDTPRNLHLTVGSTAGNTCYLEVPSFNTTDIEYGDRDQTLIEVITGQCAADTDAGDDELTIRWS